MKVALVQRRTLRLLFVTQIISGIAVAIGASVGALLAADIAGIGMSGIAQSAIVVGAALFALPATAIVHRQGRRPSLAAGYFVAAVGSIIVVIAAVRGSTPLLFVGFFLFGGATAAGLQARYAAVDLAPAALRRPSSLLDRVGDDAGRGRRTKPRSSCGRVTRWVRCAHTGRPVLLLGVAVWAVDTSPRAAASTGPGGDRARRNRKSGRADVRCPSRRDARRATGRRLAGVGSFGRERDGHWPPGDDRRHGDDARVYRRRGPRRGAHAARRGRGSQFSHCGHVRVFAGLRLAYRQTRPTPSHFRGHRVAAHGVCLGRKRRSPPSASGRRTDDARSWVVGRDGRRVQALCGLQPKSVCARV